MTTTAQPIQTTDPAEQILRSAQGLDDNTRANAWDVFHGSANEDDLASKLQNMNLPQDVKASLWDAKHSVQPQPSSTDVAARHARSREGLNINYGETGGETGIQGVVTGIGKEGLKTAQGVVQLANRAADTLNPSWAGPTPQIPVPSRTLDTTTHGVAETVGGIAENIGEFATGEEILKGLTKYAKLEKLAQNSPRIAKFLQETPDVIKRIVSGGTKAAVIGGAQGGVKGTAEGHAVEGATGGALGGAVGGALAEGAAPGLKALARVFGLGGLSGEEAMVKAGRPSVTEDTNFRKSLATAAPKIVEAAKDAPLKTVGDFEDLLHDAAQHIRQNVFNPMIQRNAKQMVSAQPIAKNIRVAITDQMREYAPQEAKELEDFAVKFAKDMPLGKAENDLQYFNAQLKKFYKANAMDQVSALKTSGTVAKYEAAADGLRDVIYSRLKELGENAPEETQRQYGALKNLERVFAKRATVADRQAPLNLPQILSLAGGAGEAATAVMMGHPVTALAGAVPIAVSTAAKMRNAPESLIRQGVKSLGKEISAPAAIEKTVKQAEAVAPTAAIAGEKLAEDNE